MIFFTYTACTYHNYDKKKAKQMGFMKNVSVDLFLAIKTRKRSFDVNCLG